MTIRVYIIKVNNNKMKNNIYVVANDSQQALLIDPAWDFLTLVSSIQSLNLSVKGVLVTHHHFDHLNLAEKISNHYNVPIVISKIESHYYNIHFSNKLFCFNEQEIKIGDILVKPIITPGHTKGSTCYLVDNKLFSGDTLFIEGCGTCSCNGGSSTEMFYSLGKLKQILQNDTQIYPGHSYYYPPGQTMKFVLENNIYMQITDVAMFEKYMKNK